MLRGVSLTTRNRRSSTLRRLVRAAAPLLALAPWPACSGETGFGDGNGGFADAAPPDAPPLPPFSFFVTSLETMRKQSGSQDGFGGNLGGLAGADAICQNAAADVGFGQKTWRAFLSVTNDGTGKAVNAIDRIGEGPWYDRSGRLVAMNKTGLVMTRPAGDAQVKTDLPDENAVALKSLGDTHDVMTGSNSQGQLASTDPKSTCYDWTSIDGQGTKDVVTVGHSWPSMSGQHWIASHKMRGCSPGVNLVQNGPGSGTCVGCGGGWGGIYCFALEP
jgi:hypothetical protein